MVAIFKHQQRATGLAGKPFGAIFRYEPVHRAENDQQWALDRLGTAFQGQQLTIFFLRRLGWQGGSGM